MPAQGEAAAGATASEGQEKVGGLIGAGRTPTLATSIPHGMVTVIRFIHNRAANEAVRLARTVPLATNGKDSPPGR
jgi:hypothetical protein